MLPIGSAMLFIAVSLAQDHIMCQGGVYAVSAGTAGRCFWQNALALNLQSILLWGHQEHLNGATL